MKFKVGDKVKVVRCIIHKNCEQINTIGKIINTVANRLFPYELENCDEIFREDELELVQEKQFTKADLKDGDIVTYRNGSKKTVFSDKLITGGGFLGSYLTNYNDELEEVSLKNSFLDIVKVERPTHYETVFEIKEEILDKTEKRYLASVIKPFRDKVKYIYKRQEWNTNKEFIHISLKEDKLDLPYFKKGTMYKGMETDRNYTLEELEL